MSDTINPKTGISFKQEKINALKDYAKINNIVFNRIYASQDE